MSDKAAWCKQEMDSELERYHKSCAALELNVGEGRSKFGALQKELTRQRSQTQDAHQAIRCISSFSCPPHPLPPSPLLPFLIVLLLPPLHLMSQHSLPCGKASSFPGVLQLLLLAMP